MYVGELLLLVNDSIQIEKNGGENVRCFSFLSLYSFNGLSLARITFDIVFVVSFFFFVEFILNPCFL